MKLSFTGTSKQNCINSYERKVQRYIDTYEKDYQGYPANQKRLDIMCDLIRRHEPRRVLYIGCGACVPMIRLMRESGCEIVGIDFSPKMVQRGKEVLKEHGMDTDLVQEGDIEDVKCLPSGPFDFAIAAGVFTHLADDRRAFMNLYDKLKPGGTLAVEFRNELFSCFSFNRFSYDFFMNVLLEHIDFPVELKHVTEIFFKNVTGISEGDMIAPKSTHVNKGVFNKFHNPLSIGESLGKYGFNLKNNYFYHYHVLPPALEKQNSNLFNQLSLSLENPTDWRGHLMASAFISEATKIDEREGNS